VFLVDTDTPGYSIAGKSLHMMGDVTYEIALDDVRVPAANLVGNEGDGMKHAQNWIGANRIHQAARGLGVTERCLEMTARYAKERKTFGAPLSGRQAVQFAFADLYTRHQAGKMLTYRTACNIDAGKAARHETYMTKIFCTELAFEAADRCMQFHGAMGLSTEMPIERLWRWSRSFMITGGAVEVMRATLARELFELYD
jgi:acyl-CoA dehydrogenase